ncbi:hypothetical protein HNR62_002964 [Oceanisphaera litoralis]|uniref:heparinase II/III domain-containing protein n=1 Tax=Oceanisphaera litoralis TaxID=225144 RepID=UPI001957E554|nr:heparinase II/III family protein [Oceanisphaera litoralis]MBM7457062.1 hypothetical protein [Oceanisphaera litoralis]
MNKIDLSAIEKKYKIILSKNYKDLTTKGYVARKGVVPINLELPFKWENSDSNVNVNLQSWRFLSAFWYEYITTGKIDVFNSGLDFVLDWYDFFLIKENRSRHIWYDMSTGIRAYHLGLINNLIESKTVSEHLSEERKKIIRNLSDLHIKKLSNPDFISQGNHGIYQVLGLQILSQSLNNKELNVFCHKKLEELLDKSFDENYINTENSPFYHKYNVDIIRSIDENSFDKLRKKIKIIKSDSFFASSFLTAPNGCFYNIGDSEGLGLNNINNIEFPDRYKNLVIPSDTHFGIDLSESGYIIIRDNSYEENGESLIFYGTSKSLVHKHSDNLSFIYFTKGIEIFTDPGKYTYAYGPWRESFISDTNHNTVGHENKTTKITESNISWTSIKKLEYTNKKYSIKGSTKKENLEHEREIEYRPSEYIIINDHIKNKSNENVEIRFQLSEHIDLAFWDNNRLYICKADNCLATLEFEKKPCNIDIVRGQGYKGWVSS